MLISRAGKTNTTNCERNDELKGETNSSRLRKRSHDQTHPQEQKSREAGFTIFLSITGTQFSILKGISVATNTAQIRGFVHS